MSRLNPVDMIPDDMRRTELYRRILAYLSDNTNDVKSYEVRADEQRRVDLCSYRIYGTIDLQWVIMLVCEMDDSLAGLPVGFTIKVPPIGYLQRLIREVRDGR